MPKVSVCLIVCKTKAEYLRECLSSILDQTFQDFELLMIMDYAKNTEYEKIIKNYTDKRIEYIKPKKDEGVSEAKNRLLNIAKGEYITFAKPEDIFHSLRLEKQVSYMETHPECGIVGSWYKRNSDGKIIKQKENNAKIEMALKSKNEILPPSLMIRTSVLFDNEIKYLSQNSPLEDYALMFDLVGKTKFYNLQEVLLSCYKTAINSCQKQEIYKKIIQKNKILHPELWSIKRWFNTICGQKDKKEDRRAIKIYKKYTGSKVNLPQVSTSKVNIFNKEIKFRFKRGVIFASYSQEEKISDRVLYYLRNLKKYSDFIIFVADNSISEAEMQKLSGLADIAYFQKHGEYDFGSYKIGYNIASKNGYLEKIEQLTFANDSVVGPFGDLKDFFANSKNTDFYGLTGNIQGYLIGNQKIYDIGCRHIQSYLFVLSKKFFLHSEFISFINGVKSLSNKIEIIIAYEQGLSRLARKIGFKLKTFLPFQKDITLNNWQEFLKQGMFIKTRQLRKLTEQDFEFIRNYMHQKHFEDKDFKTIVMGKE